MQLYVLETSAPVDTTKLTKKQRAGAVESLMSLKENHNGDIKGHEFTDAIKKLETIKRDNAYSPIVAIDSVLIRAAVNTHEGQYVANFNTPGSYIYTKTDGDVTILLNGSLADLILMLKVAPTIYQNYVSMSR